MQTLKHELSYRPVHKFLRDIDRLYSAVSDSTFADTTISPLFDSGARYDSSFKDVFDILSLYGNIDMPMSLLADFEIEPMTTSKFDEKNVLVCFSGGKDSFTAAKYYIDLGYNVQLYHVQGLNYAYCGKSSEHLFAEDCAKYLGVPIYIDHISYSGYHSWTEHPLKNFVLMNMALSYAVNSGFTDKIVVGTFQTSILDDNVFSVCGGDCIEMWEAYKTIVHRFLPSFDILIPNLNYESAFKVLQTIPDAIPHTMSCVTSNRFRFKLREKTQRDYNIELFPGRCGVCWKCAVEYIWCADHDIVEYNEDYYIKCILTLYNTVLKENGYRESNVHILWHKYFFYPINESKAKERLLYGTISNGKVKSARKVIAEQISCSTV